VTRFLGFDFATLSIFTGQAEGRVAFIWQAPGTPTIPSNLTEKDFPWMARQCFAGKEVSFLSPGELPAEAEIDRATHERIQVRSNHCVPLLAGETPMGVLNVGTFNREQGIAAELLRRQRLLGEIFANALARKRADESLRASEEQISLAAESANLGVWSWDISKDRSGLLKSVATYTASVLRRRFVFKRSSTSFTTMTWIESASPSSRHCETEESLLKSIV
jgi:formate hydrogenlyase transcriptional activator